MYNAMYEHMAYRDQYGSVVPCPMKACKEFLMNHSNAPLMKLCWAQEASQLWEAINRSHGIHDRNLQNLPSGDYFLGGCSSG